MVCLLEFDSRSGIVPAVSNRNIIPEENSPKLFVCYTSMELAVKGQYVTKGTLIAARSGSTSNNWDVADLFFNKYLAAQLELKQFR